MYMNPLSLVIIFAQNVRPSSSHPFVVMWGNWFIFDPNILSSITIEFSKQSTFLLVESGQT